MIDPNSPRAVASRRNGAKSRGPKTPEGKARASRNALKHGLTAERWIVLYDEDTKAFDALLEAWETRFAPADDTEAVLVRRLAEADWRLRRATRLEFEMFTEYQHQDDDGTNALGLAMIRDGHGANAFANLLRYRGGAEREFHRLYKLLSEAKAAREAVGEVAKRTEPGGTGHEPPEPERDEPGEVGPAEVEPVEVAGDPGPATPATERPREPQEPPVAFIASARTALAGADRSGPTRCAGAPSPAVPRCESNPKPAASADLRPGTGAAAQGGAPG
jgi:hypothetical protein